MRTTLIALALLLFCLPTVSQAAEGVNEFGFQAEGIITHGDVLDVDCFSSSRERACNILVRVTPEQSSVLSAVNGLFFEGVWNCTFVTLMEEVTASLGCTSIALRKGH